MVSWNSSYVEDDEPDPPLWPLLVALVVWCVWRFQWAFIFE
jgi:hypothetical protein